ncbi:D-cysteine desulfhydrase [Morganella psychrotolerans]|uniref:L-cysteate sulfo-lyase n=1 Tax=Morganella psychrotolerans TaxID=368603 RepID=A0A1B8H2X0_9GAMM|nr:D-cysteine desulfhydrase [Morganella psychrotolerans]OBU03421.1 D-cysteine desulfhydrase [Morganella psychrotolerans]
MSSSVLSAGETRLHQTLALFSKIDLLGGVMPLNKLNHLSRLLGRDIYIKRDDLTPLAAGGNKLRKLEFLMAEALEKGAKTIVTAGAIQSNHVRQTAAVAAMYGLKCVALLENPIGSQETNFLNNGNKLLSDLFGAQCVMCDALTDPDAQMQTLVDEMQLKDACIIPVGGSNLLGSLGYVQCALEIAQQQPEGVEFGAVVVASGSAGTHAGLSIGLQLVMPQTPVIGVTVSRTYADQAPKVIKLQNELAPLFAIETPAPVILWDDYFAPEYGMPNAGGLEAIELLARCEGILLDPVYTGKAMAGLIDQVRRNPQDTSPLLFVHTGGATGLFAYPEVSAPIK